MHAYIHTYVHNTYINISNASDKEKKEGGQGHHNLLAFQTFRTSSIDEIFRNNFGPDI